MDEAGGQGLEQLVEFLLPGGGQGGQGAAVEGIPKGYDGIAVRALLLGSVFPGCLDGALVGLCAGIGEENLFHAGPLTEHLGQHGTWLSIVQIGGVLYLLQLGNDGLLPGFISHAEGVDGDAGAQVDVFFSGLIPDQRALAAGDLQIKPLIGIGNILVVQSLDIHAVSS